MHCRDFSSGLCTELGYIFEFLKFQIFFGVLKIPDIFWG